MAEDWAADVKKYAANADDAVIAGIVRYCGIALTKRDSSLVAMSDKKETDRVRENFLKKKLGRTEADSALDAAIAAVGDQMKADRTKNRVTVYYLLADKFGSTSLFVKASNTKPKAPAKASGAAAEKKPAAKIATKTTKPPTKPKAKITGSGAAAAGGAPASAANDEGVAAKAGAALGAAGAAVSGAAEKAADAVGDAVGAVGDTAGKAGAAVAGAAGAAAAGAAALASGAGSAVSGGVDRVTGAASNLVGSSNNDDGGSNWLWWLLGGLLVLFAIWWVFLRGPAEGDAAPASVASEAAAPAAAVGTAPSGDLATAPAEGSVTVPAGAGVTSELRDGKPVVKVYFDTGKTTVVPDFTATAGGLKAWLDSHAGSSLAVSGYADPSGNAALNAALSKKRAQAVQAALIAAGIPEASAALVKPAETTDATVDKAAARRVEVVVR